MGVGWEARGFFGGDAFGVGSSGDAMAVVFARGEAGESTLVAAAPQPAMTAAAAANTLASASTLRTRGRGGPDEDRLYVTPTNVSPGGDRRAVHSPGGSCDRRRKAPRAGLLGGQRQRALHGDGGA